jgi:hypothetical protein
MSLILTFNKNIKYLINHSNRSNSSLKSCEHIISKYDIPTSQNIDLKLYNARLQMNLQLSVSSAHPKIPVVQGSSAGG